LNSFSNKSILTKRYSTWPAFRISIIMRYNIFTTDQVQVGSYFLHYTTLGNPANPPIIFLHGYPETSMEFHAVMRLLHERYFLVAFDLPGIGASTNITRFDKLSIAAHIMQAIEQLQLQTPVVVGHDVGGMIAFSLSKNFASDISKAVIIGTSIPGIEPWEQVKANPHIWHFAFYQVPELPEQLIRGKHYLLFEYFYKTIAFNKTAITAENKNWYIKAYDTEDALKTSLGWYRAFHQDEQDNASVNACNTPVLYLKGEKDFGDLNVYLQGFKKNGCRNISGIAVPNSAHFVPEENPDFVAGAIDSFIEGSGIDSIP